MKAVTRKLLSWLLAAALLCSLAVLSGFAGRSAMPGAQYDAASRDAAGQQLIAPAESFAGGSGTEEDPYQISSAAELALLSDVYERASLLGRSDEQVKPYYDAHYVLTADIVLNEHPEGEDWSQTPPACGWLPIGLHEDFHGFFDGAGHTVSGMYLNADAADGEDNWGLFASNYGTIKDLALDKSYICVSGQADYVGGIAGESGLATGIIQNCSVSADICCYDASCGGVAGNNWGMVENCSFAGTVTCQQEDGSGNYIGGIVGYNSGEVIGCENSGAVTHAALDNGTAGGIVGGHMGGQIVDCTNAGAITGSESAGGVAGSAHHFDQMSFEDYIEGETDILDCTNAGAVSTEGMYAGGIAGQYTTDHMDCAPAVSGCTNSGPVSCLNYNGGILGYITLQGTMTVSGCANSAALSGQTTGGVVGSAMELCGSLSVTDCANTAPITAQMYGAGIVACGNIGFWDDKPLDVTISGCENTGSLTVARGGGIAGVFVSVIPAGKGGNVTVTLTDDVSAADITCQSSNSFVGGIAGNVGVAGGTVTVQDCRTSGVISYADLGVDQQTVDTKQDELRLALSRMGGGIVGTVDSGMYLSNDNDGLTGANINAKGAKILFTGCHSDMTFQYPEEDKYVYADDGAPIFTNHFGGILGFATDEEGFGFQVEDCTYTGCDRGLGMAGMPDVGEKQ